MQLTTAQWCDLLGGTLEGNPEIIITHPAAIEDSTTGAISFIANKKYFHFVYTTGASALIVGTEMKFDRKVNATIIRVADPYLAFAQVLQKFNTPFESLTGIEEPCYMHDSALIGKNVYIGALSYLGKEVKLEDDVKIFPQVYLGEEVFIGKGSIIYPGVKIYAKCRIGSNCIIHSGAVIGSDGFGHAPMPDGSYMKIPQLGNVVLEDNVEVGANTTIDRSTMGSTIIHKGVKLDNLVQVGHNAEIGENTVIAAQSGISGSTKIGRNCMIGGQVGFVGHIEIADGSRINAQSGVSKSIFEKNKSWNGSPAYEYIESLRAQAILRKLPLLQKELEQLKAEAEKRTEAQK